MRSTAASPACSVANTATTIMTMWKVIDAALFPSMVRQDRCLRDSMSMSNTGIPPVLTIFYTTALASE